MKTLDLKKLIKEEIQNVITEGKAEDTNEKTIDEIGKFFVVKKPKSGMAKDEMVYEATVFHPIEEAETVGVYKNKSEANRIATTKLKEYEDRLKEIRSHMDEFRKTKKDIDDKKNKVKDLIQKAR
jgi:hypothetical protein